MDNEDIVMIVIFCVLSFIGGVCAGSALMERHKDTVAIRTGHGQYSPTTGHFEWKPIEKKAE